MHRKTASENNGGQDQKTSGEQRRWIIVVIVVGAAVEAIWAAVMVFAVDWREPLEWPRIEPVVVGYLAVAGVVTVALTVWGRCFDGTRAMWLVIAFAIVFRVTVWPMPSISDDPFRYVWDGRVTISGVSPYAFAPAAPEFTALHGAEEFSRLNSPDFRSVYPPVSQLVFALGAWVSQTWFDGGFRPAFLTIKAVYVALDVGAILALASILGAWGSKRRYLVWYAWNPLPIFEFAAAGHSDVAMAFFVALTIAAMTHQRPGLAAMALSGAILAKLVPILFVPFFLRYVGLKYALPMIAVGVAAYWPFDLVAAVSALRELRLYAQHFEFNASLYYLGAWTWRTATDTPSAGVVGPVLAVGFAVAWATLAVICKPRDVRDFVRIAWVVVTLYLCFATTVHPWYVAWGVVLLPVVPSLAWWWLSCIVVLTYFTYLGPREIWRENFVLIAVEWLVFAGLLFVFDLRRSLLDWLMRRRGWRKYQHIAPYLTGHSLLDAGCAEGHVGALAAQQHPDMRVTLVDVIDLNRTSLPVVIYDGATMPFADGEFDTVALYAVLHHCADPDAVLREAMRVGQKRLIVVESVYRTTGGKALLTVLDRIANRLRSDGAMGNERLHFRTVPQWRTTFARAGWRLTAERTLSRWPHYAVLFVLDRPAAVGGPVSDGELPR